MIDNLKDYKKFLKQCVDVYGEEDEMIEYEFEELFNQKKINFFFVRSNLFDVINELRKVYPHFRFASMILKLIDEYNVFERKHYVQFISTMKDIEQRTKEELENIIGSDTNPQEYIDEIKQNSRKYFEAVKDTTGEFSEREKKAAKKKIEKLGRVVQSIYQLRNEKRRYAGIILNLLFTRLYPDIEDYAALAMEAYTVFPEIFDGSFESMAEKNKQQMRTPDGGIVEIEVDEAFLDNTNKTKIDNLLAEHFKQKSEETGEEIVDNSDPVIDCVMEYFRKNKERIYMFQSNESNYPKLQEYFEKSKYIKNQNATQERIEFDPNEFKNAKPEELDKNLFSLKIEDTPEDNE